MVGVVLGPGNYLCNQLHKVRGTAYPQWAAVEHMGVDHGGTQIIMAQQLLDRADVLAPLQQVSCKGVSEGVATGLLGHPSLRQGSLHRLLNQARIQMVTALSAGFLVSPAVLLREDLLPGPIAVGLRVFSGQGIWQGISTWPQPAARSF